MIDKAAQCKTADELIAQLGDGDKIKGEFVVLIGNY